MAACAADIMVGAPYGFGVRPARVPPGREVCPVMAVPERASLPRLPTREGSPRQERRTAARAFAGSGRTIHVCRPDPANAAGRRLGSLPTGPMADTPAGREPPWVRARMDHAPPPSGHVPAVSAPPGRVPCGRGSVFLRRCPRVSAPLCRLLPIRSGNPCRPEHPRTGQDRARSPARCRRRHVLRDPVRGRRGNHREIHFGIIVSEIRPNRDFNRRFFADPGMSFFLFGPRGTG